MYTLYRNTSWSAWARVLHKGWRAPCRAIDPGSRPSGIRLTSRTPDLCPDSRSHINTPSITAVNDASLDQSSNQPTRRTTSANKSPDFENLFKMFAHDLYVLPQHYNSIKMLLFMYSKSQMNDSLYSANNFSLIQRINISENIYYLFKF